jgi:hypothetical protein
MSAWVLVAVGLAAAAALAGAAWTDRRNRQRREAAIQAMLAPGGAAGPDTASNTASGPAPGPASGLPAKPSLDDEQREQIRAAIRTATVIEGGWARSDFVTDEPGRWAVAAHPVVLVTPAVASFRELLPAVEAARAAGTGLVVVATQFGTATLDTLVMNAVTSKLPGVAVRAPSQNALGVAAMATGGEVADTPALKAGYLPKGTLGTCATWVSAGAQSWALDLELTPPP